MKILKHIKIWMHFFLIVKELDVAKKFRSKKLGKK